jgi:hypothetical protein
MTAFPEFQKKHEVGTFCTPASQDVIDSYQDRLPVQLLEEWQEKGWCSYSKGLIWLVNPSDFREVLEDWLDPSDDALVFGRTAFGDLFLWRNNEVEFLSTQYAKIANLIDDVTLFFEYSLCSETFLNDVLDRKLFRKALKQYGQLEQDECYGFEPVLALGGSGEIDTIRKVKLREYLGILSQVAGT